MSKEVKKSKVSKWIPVEQLLPAYEPEDINTDALESKHDIDANFTHYDYRVDRLMQFYNPDIEFIQVHKKQLLAYLYSQYIAGNLPKFLSDALYLDRTNRINFNMLAKYVALTAVRAYMDMQDDVKQVQKANDLEKQLHTVEKMLIEERNKNQFVLNGDYKVSWQHAVKEVDKKNEEKEVLKEQFNAAIKNVERWQNEANKYEAYANELKGSTYKIEEKLTLANKENDRLKEEVARLKKELDSNNIGSYTYIKEEFQESRHIINSLQSELGGLRMVRINIDKILADSSINEVQKPLQIFMLLNPTKSSVEYPFYKIPKEQKQLDAAQKAAVQLAEENKILHAKLQEYEAAYASYQRNYVPIEQVKLIQEEAETQERAYLHSNRLYNETKGKLAAQLENTRLLEEKLAKAEQSVKVSMQYQLDSNGAEAKAIKELEVWKKKYDDIGIMLNKTTQEKAQFIRLVETDKEVIKNLSDSNRHLSENLEAARKEVQVAKNGQKQLEDTVKLHKETIEDERVQKADLEVEVRRLNNLLNDKDKVYQASLVVCASCGRLVDKATLDEQDICQICNSGVTVPQC